MTSRPQSRPPSPPDDLVALGEVLARLGLMALLIVGAALLVTASVAPTAGLAASIVRTVDSGLLDYPPLPDDLRELAQRSVILDRDGNRLSIVREENRVLVGFEEMPQHVRDAVVATEDHEFYEHEGVSWPSIARAALSNYQAGEITSGASTITQQLVKNLVLETTEQTLDRKLQEAVYAIELERRMGKDQILEHYLNTAYFANGVYGIGTASEHYFGKHISELSVTEGATLAGMLRAPERNDPTDNPDNALGRREIVLGQMARHGMLEEAEARRLAREPLGLDVRERRGATEEYLVTYVIELLKRSPALGEDEATRFRYLATGGLEIRTTIDPELQDLADEAIAAHLDEDEDTLAALTSVDPRTGEILAIGFGPKPFGKGEGRVDVNPAVPHLGSPGRQTGSAFKPFAAVAALEDGVSPAYTTNTPSPYQPQTHCTGRGWTPGNYSDAGGGVMDMSRAIAVSSNVYFSHVVDQLIGPASLKETAERLGIDKDLGGHCASVLGTDDVHMLDMASAFGTLANQGTHCDPFVIAEVVDANGRVLDRGGDRCSDVVDRGIAARVTNMLEGPIRSGTASRNGQIGRPAAGKTGTSQNYENAWFVGFVPQVSTAVWVGLEDPDFMSHPACPRGITGGCVPAMIWRDFMRGTIEHLELPVERFPAPPPIPTDTVPDVVGELLDVAEVELDEAGFFADPVTVEHFAPEGTVIAQKPTGGATAPKGSGVALEVSDGAAPPPEMPDLHGMTEREAREVLDGIPLQLEIVVEYVPADPEQVDTVVGQNPPPGFKIADGRRIRLDVGRQREEPQPTPTPTPSPSEPPDEDDDNDGEDDRGPDGDGSPGQDTDDGGGGE